MENFSTWISENLHITPLIQRKLLITLLVIIVLTLIRQTVLRIISRSKGDLKVLYAWKKITSYLASGLGVITVLFVWMEEIQSLSTFLGLLSAGLAIALKDPVANFFGWLYIVFRQPFEMGDRVEIGDVAGDVIDISMTEFALMEIGNWVEADQSTGRVIYVPAGKVFTQPIKNFNQAFDHIWNEIPITVTFESNWERAKQLLLDIENQRAKEFGLPQTEELRRIGKRMTLRFSKLTPTVYTSVRSNGILLTMRYLCSPKNRRGSEQVIWEEVLRAFAKASDINFAYPTQRIYFPERQEDFTGKIAPKDD